MYGHSNLVEGFDSTWVAKFMTFSILYAGILYMQMHYGSRFFFPSACRKRAYEQYNHSLFEERQYRNHHCGVCLNDLEEEEMEYADSNRNYNYTKYDRDIFIKLDCDHTFHPN